MKTVKLPEPVEMQGDCWDFYDSLEKNGWKEISRATFSRVFSHPKKPGRVLKVARDDPAYNGFLEAVLAHPGNPFFPKIYNVKRYNYPGNESLTVVELERLSAWETPYRSSPKWFQIDAWRGAMEIYAYFGRIPHMRGWRSRWEMQAANILLDLFKRYRGDLHAGNVLLRGNQPVITDPVF